MTSDHLNSQKAVRKPKKASKAPKSKLNAHLSINPIFQNTFFDSHTHVIINHDSDGVIRLQIRKSNEPTRCLPDLQTEKQNEQIDSDSQQAADLIPTACNWGC